MRKHNVSGRELFVQALHSLQQRIIVRDKNLNVVTELGQFPRRTDKIWNRTRRSVPNENLKTFAAQVRGHTSTDNSEADHSNLLVRWMGHSGRRSAKTKFLVKSCGQNHREATQKFANLAVLLAVKSLALSEVEHLSLLSFGSEEIPRVSGNDKRAHYL
jgi:hypothetical protein